MCYDVWFVKLGTPLGTLSINTSAGRGIFEVFFHLAIFLRTTSGRNRQNHWQADQLVVSGDKSTDQSIINQSINHQSRQVCNFVFQVFLHFFW